MHCNGKCHLMKELAKAAETENPKSSDKKEINPVVEILFFQELPSISVSSLNLQYKEKITTTYFNLYSYSNRNSVFHPPTILS